MRESVCLYMRMCMRVRALGACICAHVHVRVACVCLLRMDRCQLLRVFPITSRAVLSTTDAINGEHGLLMRHRYSSCIFSSSTNVAFHHTVHLPNALGDTTC